MTVYQPDNFRPYTFSIFSAHIPNLRKQWLFFDLLSAASITGQVDNCLFSLHKPQSIGRTSEGDLHDCTWKRMVSSSWLVPSEGPMGGPSIDVAASRADSARPFQPSCALPLVPMQSRFRVDGVPLDHLQNSADTGPLSWIAGGKADLVADIRFPREPGDDVDLNTILGDIVDNLDEALRSPNVPNATERIPARPEVAGRKPLIAPSVSLRSMLGIDADDAQNASRRVVSIDLDIRFKDIKAAIPVSVAWGRLAERTSAVMLQV